MRTARFSTVQTLGWVAIVSAAVGLPACGRGDPTTDGSLGGQGGGDDGQGGNVAGQGGSSGDGGSGQGGDGAVGTGTGGEGASGGGGAGCDPGIVACGGSCVNLLNNPRNCGACGAACNFDEICVAGICVALCSDGEVLCSGDCVDLLTDASNCGACGAACAPDETCAEGMCQAPCAGAACGLCSDVMDLGSSIPQVIVGSTVGSDDSFAPGCAPGGADEIFAFTAPATAAYAFDTVGSSYDTLLAIADEGCAELACNDDALMLQSRVEVALEAGETVYVVVDGFAGQTGDFTLNVGNVVCAPGLTGCDGVCTDVSSDPVNCGACGSVCAIGEACIGGACELLCGAGLTSCDGFCVDLASDSANCGACGVECAPGLTCSGGACLGSCGGAACGLCDGVATLGPGAPAVASGSTVSSDNDYAPSCAPSGADEIFSFTAPLAGGYVFDTVGSTYDTLLAVIDGDCREMACNDDAMGLQSRVTLSLTAGETVYAVVDGYAGRTGSFTLHVNPTGGGCPPGLVACGGACVDTRTDPANCGACGVICGFGEACSSGVCQLACPPGTADCGGSCVDVLNDPANCGGCGIVCGVGQSCSSGTCVAGCPATALPSATPQTVGGSTMGLLHALTPSCVMSSTAPEAIYAFTAPVTRTYTLDTFGSSFDTVLDVRNGSCGGPSLACNDDAMGLQSRVTVSLVAGQTVVIVVDGFGPSAGSYVLNIQ